VFSVRQEPNYVHCLDLPKASNDEVSQGHNIILRCMLLLRNVFTRSYLTWKKPCFRGSKFVYNCQLLDFIQASQSHS
jgi:hypothetical protein